MSESKGLPKGWAWVNVERCCVADVGFAFKSSEFVEEGIRLLRGENMEPGALRWKDVRYWPEDKLKGYEHLLLAEGDIVLAMDRPLVSAGLKIARVRATDLPCLLVQRMARLRVMPTLNTAFLFNAMQTQRFITHLVGEQQGTQLPHISGPSIKEFVLPFPPLSEQHRIVEKIEELFSDLDAGVASLQRAKANLKRYRVSVLKSAVEGRLTEEWRKEHPQTEDGQMLLDRILRERWEKWEKEQLAKFKEKGKEPPKNWQGKYEEPSAPETSELPELPEGWVYCTLEQIYESKKKGTRTGPFGTLLAKHEHQTRGVPVIGIENIGEMEFHQGSKIHITEAKAKELEDYELLPGDIVISRSGTVGEVCVIPADVAQARMSTNLMRIRLYPNGVSPLYFCLLLHGSPFVKRQIHSLCSGSTRDFLNTEILKTLVFPVPPPAEQAEVLGVVEERLSQIESAEKTIDAELIRAKRLRQSILKQAFDGKFVPQDPKDEPASVLLERIKASREAEQPKKKAKKVKAK